MAGGQGEGSRGAPPPSQLPAAEGGASAPILYFDLVPVFGMRGGVYSLVLETLLQDVGQSSAAENRRVVTAHLRTTAEGLRSLKAAIEGIELMTAKAEGGTN